MQSKEPQSSFQSKSNIIILFGVSTLWNKYAQTYHILFSLIDFGGWQKTEYLILDSFRMTQYHI